MAQAIVKNEEIEYYGPYGSNLSENYRMQLVNGERFKEVTVRHGDVVDALRFVVAKPDGTTNTYQFGGNTGAVSKIALKDGEYLTKISGTSGNYQYQSGKVMIATVKIHTNLNPNGYGPFGTGRFVVRVENFSSPEKNNLPIVGFMGRNGTYVESVGIMISKAPEIEIFGPYGSKLPQNYDQQLEDGERYKEITVTHGSIVDSLGFVVAKRDGSTATYQFGGKGAHVGKIILKDGEYVTAISGTSGNYKYQSDNGVLIATLKIHTNMNQNGYGPFGKGIDVQNVEKFASPNNINSSIIGYFGRNGRYLEAAGVLVQKK
ncbi:mannose/glucose-specific lectin [Spinacia oleracea]|uniref:Mannose/glucose-specific lectin n=1 Tax=Spinacia oleracea TaxID=3562 RepID=A0ABM3R1T6_SPIOL|nr:mannose/glucose-specific lectin-like [Spinacia oleracea]